MRLRMGVGGNARPIGFIGRPVDKARVMLWDEDRPFGAWQLAGLPFAPPGRIERDLTARFSVDIGARVSRVCQHMINCGVARVDPPDRCTIILIPAVEAEQLGFGSINSTVACRVRLPLSVVA